MKFNRLFFVGVAIVCLFTANFYNACVYAQPCNLLTNNDYIRVGISNKNNQLEYSDTLITTSGSFDVVNLSDGSLVTSAEHNDMFSINMSDNKFNIVKNNSLVINSIQGPLLFISTDGAYLQVANITRKGKPALYRGNLEIDKSSTKDNLLSVVNVLPIEDYLKGVVPNELPVYFGLEALKAQAVAARNYAIRPRVKYYKQFDICDSVNCQVYFGANTEDKLADKAINETKGLVALYNDEVILALYSSTAGGFTESYENAFSDPSTNAFPAREIPYLKGVADFGNVSALNDENLARSFYYSTQPAFDVDSGYYRWNKTWAIADLQNILAKNLYYNRFSKFITPSFTSVSDFGEIKDIQVLSRGISGKAMFVKISTTKGEWTVAKELMIRKIFTDNGKMLPSANVIFDKVYDPNGNLSAINAFGGGLGHGVGMSQYGAGYMSKHGYTFDQILQHYYTGISIGTAPILLTTGTPAVRQKFSAPAEKAVLILYNYDSLDRLNIVINSKKISLPIPNGQKYAKFDLTQYVKTNNNEIIYSLPDGETSKKIKAWVEVFNKI